MTGNNHLDLWGDLRTDIEKLLKQYAFFDDPYLAPRSDANAVQGCASRLQHEANQSTEAERPKTRTHATLNCRFLVERPLA